MRQRLRAWPITSRIIGDDTAHLRFASFRCKIKWQVAESLWGFYYGKSKSRSVQATPVLFLACRIRNLGIRSIMGVPGDMNLELLDYIDDVEDLEWSEYSH